MSIEHNIGNPAESFASGISGTEKVLQWDTTGYDINSQTPEVLAARADAITEDLAQEDSLLSEADRAELQTHLDEINAALNKDQRMAA